jgi:hypothetical protein
MPHPARSPQHRYSESTTWWQCTICSKLCKSKGGRTQHIRRVHGNISSNSANLDRSGNESTALDQDDLSLPRFNGSQDEDMHPEPIDLDFTIPPSNANHTSPLTPHFALSSSPPLNAVPDSNDFCFDRDSQLPIGSTVCHPVMNGE